ncbi:hypothetical protein [Humibacillus xanthopallidus]|uniref:hypothetical protein n=1 Tax=Humibacillus xanthopallidus TaxID=412689 RepID=UPI00384F3116
MSDDRGEGPDPAPAEEQFTVPIPSAAAPQSVPGPGQPPPPSARSAYPPPTSPPLPYPPPAHDRLQTQVLPVAEPTRQLPRPPWEGGPPVATPGLTGAPAPATAATQDPDAVPDPLLAQIGAALFWITVGWWVTVVVRLLGTLVRQGPISTLFIESVGRWPEEIIVAAVISVLAALVLLLGRGPRGRDLLGWASAALAVVTVGVAIWRLLP